jgi:integrase
MSVRKVPKAKGGGYEVRFRQGERHRSRTFRRRQDAVDFDLEVKRRRRLGTLADLDAGLELLSEFAEEWWRRSASRRLRPLTLRRYEELWDRHILPRLGDLQLRELRPGVVEQFASDLARAGVGAPTRRKALYVLQSVLAYAVRLERIPQNPVQVVEKPRLSPRVARPLPPAAIEALREYLGLPSSLLVAVMAYAGLRPGEALALRWRAVRERTLAVEGAIVLGREAETKTRRRRTVRLLGPLRQDLAEHRLAAGRPADRELVFPRADGTPWTDSDYRNWRGRVFAPAAKAIGWEGARPYDLRHSFVSLLIQEGRSVAYVADQAGHSVAESARTYTHVFEEFRDAPPASAEELIRRAREQRRTG